MLEQKIEEIINDILFADITYSFEKIRSATKQEDISKYVEPDTKTLLIRINQFKEKLKEYIKYYEKLKRDEEGPEDEIFHITEYLLSDEDISLKIIEYAIQKVSESKVNSYDYRIYAEFAESRLNSIKKDLSYVLRNFMKKEI